MGSTLECSRRLEGLPTPFEAEVCFAVSFLVGFADVVQIDW